MPANKKRPTTATGRTRRTEPSANATVHVVPAHPAVTGAAPEMPVLPAPGGVFTMNEAAAYLRVHRTTLYKLIDTRGGDIPTFVVGKKSRRITRRALDQWIADQHGGGSAA